MKKKKRVWAQWEMDKSWLLEPFTGFTRFLEKSTAKPAALRGSFGIIVRRVEDLLCSHPFEPTFALDYVEDLDTKPAQIGKISCKLSDSHIQEEKL